LLVECRELVASVAGKSARGRDSVGDLDVRIYFMYVAYI